MSFRDMTFCTYHEYCTQGQICPRALTNKVTQDAIMWWGSDNAPISVFVELPHCFEQRGKDNEQPQT